MAKNTQAAPAASAFVLSDHQHLKAGQIVTGSETVIAALVAIGVADVLPAAVEYAASNGAEQVAATLPVEEEEAPADAAPASDDAA